ncbi:MAG: rod shape-determining protein MreC [Steroidobacteraceae bacterium]
MPGFAAGAYRPSPGRGSSPGFRYTLYAILAVVLMFVDQRRGWLAEVRYVLSGAAYPLQLAVSSPTEAWGWLQATFATRASLEAENARLEREERTLAMRSQRFEALARENGELRGLREALPPVADHWMVAEVVEVEVDSPRRRVLIDRGARNGVFKNQVVMDSHGLLGQTMRVGPWSAEVILITDPEHAVPVEIERTGVRTIAVGTGETQALALPYLPANADVKAGDLLLTSGLGGVFPQGYPVARITEVRHDTVQPAAQIRARPLAELDRLHEVMLVWFKGDHPAAPTPAAASASVRKDLPSGNPDFQPRPVPPRPQPPPPASAAAPGAKSASRPKSAAARAAKAAQRPQSAGAAATAAGTRP